MTTSEKINKMAREAGVDVVGASLVKPKKKPEETMEDLAKTVNPGTAPEPSKSITETSPSVRLPAKRKSQDDNG